LNPFGNGAYTFAIETIAGGEFIGSCGIEAVDWKIPTHHWAYFR